MFERITPLGWVVIGLVVLFIILLNLNLVALVRGQRTPRAPFQFLGKTMHTLRDPYRKNNEAAAELARRVAELRQAWKADGEGSDPPDNLPQT